MWRRIRRTTGRRRKHSSVISVTSVAEPQEAATTPHESEPFLLVFSVSPCLCGEADFHAGFFTSIPAMPSMNVTIAE